jgi:hypothetical protein
MLTSIRLRRPVSRVLAWAALLGMLLMLLAPISATATPSNWGVSWDYRLLGKLNSAGLPDPEDPDQVVETVLITGSGSFNMDQDTIDGGGSYTIFSAEGEVVGSGTWTATTFDSFEPMGPGNSPGEGGRLELEATFYGTGHLGGTTQHVVIQCSMWGEEKVGPPGYPWPPDFVEVGPYVIHVSGASMFNLNQ